MKKTVNAFDYAVDICKALPKGILMTTKSDQQVNTMTIGWGTIGIEWGKPIFIVYVRESRYTKQILDQTGEFTVNVPMGQIDPQILGFCGTKSGRDVDKILELGLTLEQPEAISVPGIRELPLTLECKVIYKQKQDLNAIRTDLVEKYYPQDVSDPSGGRNRDIHTAYYGEIVNAYLIENDR
ncbi:MAG: flavin reductase family protein [Faecousia sp.]